MFFKVEENDDKTYSIAFTDTFYKKMTPYYRGGSYWNVLYRLFNMLPQDFYHYVGFAYGASFKKSDCIRNVRMLWNDKENAKKFCDDANKRFMGII